MKINLDTPSDEVRIEIIPLIDIIFCILTFFIVVALQVTRQQAINVDLPTAKNGAASQMRENLIVTLFDDGRIYIEQQQINSEEQFTQALKNYHTTNPNGAIILRASRAAKYDLVIQALDLMKKVGGDRVSLATESVSPSGAASSNSEVPPASGTSGSIPYSGSIAPFEPYNPSGTPYYPPGTPYNPSQPLPVPGQQMPAPSSVYPINPGSLPSSSSAPNSGATKAPKKGGSTPKK